MPAVKCVIPACFGLSRMLLLYVFFCEECYACTFSSVKCVILRFGLKNMIFQCIKMCFSCKMCSVNSVIPVSFGP